MRLKNAFFVCCVFLIFCKPTKAQEVKQKTAFYTIKLVYDSLKQKTIYTVKNITIVDQVTKEQNNVRYLQSPDYLKITVVDKSKNSNQIITEHPLHKHVELFSESGEIESKSISLQEGEVTFRVPYYVGFKKIKVTEVRNFKKKKQVIIKHEK